MIVVASSDLRHYHTYQAARAQAQLLDYNNIGDVTDKKDRVVGYTAVASCAPAAENLGAPERKYLLELARKTLASVAAGGSVVEVEDKGVQPKLAEVKACFVTLMKEGALRGCIGHITPVEPLHRAVAANARSAALRDPRFPPVGPEELDTIRIEISVLTEPTSLPFNSPEDLLAKLHPNEDGVLLQIGPRTATFLPQVWAHIPDKVKFLEQLSQKAGCEASAWKGNDAAISIYHVECFEEDHGGVKPAH